MGVDDEEADEVDATPFDPVDPRGFCNIHDLVDPSFPNNTTVMNMKLTIPALCLGAAADTGN